ncbi:YqzH family protein [Niallia circulans]|uniref:YqzH family protein n=1 Tax=Niallia circulans TaxID=1397 RepID=UPI003D81AF5D
MNTLLIKKMIQKSLKQYHMEPNSLPLHEYERLAVHIIAFKKKHLELYDLVQDVFYSYITNTL